MRESIADRLDGLANSIRDLQYQIAEIKSALEYHSLYGDGRGGRLVWHGASIPASVDACMLAFTARKDRLSNELDALRKQAEGG